MKFLKVNSVTFYQSVLLGQRQLNTVNRTVATADNIDIIFCDDKIFLRDIKTSKENMKDKVVIVGLHNVRDLRVSKKDFEASPYKELFDCFDEDGAYKAPQVEETDERAALWEELDELGIQYDKRWGVNKLVEAKDAHFARG